MIQTFYYGFLLRRFSFAAKQQTHSKPLPVSLIISCRNEAENLKNNLPKIIQQEHLLFEIILIDDGSTDTTWAIMESFKQENPRIKVLKIPDSHSGNKKKALALGIAQATYEHLFFTDADCVPNSKNWLANMAACFTTDKQLVLGYGPYKKQPGLLNKLIRYETLLTAWQYFAYALSGIPYMGVGRNMGYTKSLFTKAKGFERHLELHSGDDDLFVSQVSTDTNVAVTWQNQTFMYSEPKSNFAAWIAQKRRHITTATHYKPLHKLMLGLFYSSQLLFFPLFIGLSVSGFAIDKLLYWVFIRYFFYYVNIIPAAKKLKETDLLIWAPFLELYLIVMQLRIFTANLGQKPKEW